MSKKILFVEDNVKFANALMEKMEYEFFHFTNPIEAITAFAKSYFDVVVADYEMDEMNGVSLLKILKGIQPNIRSIIVTAYPKEDLEIQALDIHVDRFISKDKSLILIARYIKELVDEKEQIKELGRRISSNTENIVVDLTAHSVKKDDEIVEITPKEFQLLILFLRNKDIALTRDEIAQELWEKDSNEIDPKAIEVLIHSLRKKLNLVSLLSVRGVGYRWNE